jgi:hypothetical protein
MKGMEMRTSINVATIGTSKLASFRMGHPAELIAE